jgi:hypothetical protein
MIILVYWVASHGRPTSALGGEPPKRIWVGTHTMALRVRVNEEEIELVVKGVDDGNKSENVLET